MARGRSRPASASPRSAPRRTKSRKVTNLLGIVSAALERIGVRPGSTILVGLSGGPDSVALLDLLNGLRATFDFKLAAAHLNHGLRGSESRRDEAFVRKLCSQYGIELTVGRAKGLTRSMPNLEEHAREQRHRFLNRVADRIGADFIALAHHADDQAETVLMRLLRGAGATGLAAMSESGPSRIIRPMLAVRRSAIVEYLHAIGAEWVTDSSNLSTDLLRNKLRLELMPMLERDYASGLSYRLTELADEMRGLNRFIVELAQASVKERLDSSRLSIAGFRDLDPIFATAILREFLQEKMGGLRRISRAHLSALLELCCSSQPSGSIDLPDGWRAQREYDSLTIESTHPIKSRPYSMKLKPSGLSLLQVNGFRFAAKRYNCGDKNTPVVEELTKLEAMFDADELSNRLMVRSMNHGDRIEPLGMSGSRKVQDIFVDRKLPRMLREHWPVVTAGGVIVWIPGMVRSRHALVTSDTTKIQYLQALPPPRVKETSVA